MYIRIEKWVKHNIILTFNQLIIVSIISQTINKILCFCSVRNMEHIDGRPTGTNPLAFNGPINILRVLVGTREMQAVFTHGFLQHTLYSPLQSNKYVSWFS